MENKQLKTETKKSVRYTLAKGFLTFIAATLVVAAVKEVTKK